MPAKNDLVSRLFNIWFLTQVLVQLVSETLRSQDSHESTCALLFAQEKDLARFLLFVGKIE